MYFFLRASIAAYGPDLLAFFFHIADNFSGTVPSDQKFAIKTPRLVELVVRNKPFPESQSPQLPSNQTNDSPLCPWPYRF